jgi:hypothetical protein
MIKYNVPNQDSSILESKKDILIGVSRAVYSYKNFTGTNNAWHDHPEVFFKKWDVTKLFNILEEREIPIESYAVLSALAAPPSKFVSPGKLYGTIPMLAWLSELREYCETAELFKEVAEVSLHLLRFQTTEKYHVYFTQSNIVKKVEDILGAEARDAKYAEVYSTLADRIRKFHYDKIDPILWIEEKFKKCIKSFKDDVAFSAIINLNSLEPDLKALSAITNDEWREIRQFLELSPFCQFTDGYIPKGWRAANDDRDELLKVVRITGDGYYYYEDGTQRRGKRHYLQNQYFVIKCTPENFKEFKESWDDKRLLAGTPTWEEYDKYGVEPKYWGEDGKSLNGRGQPAKWRKIKL